MPHHGQDGLADISDGPFRQPSAPVKLPFSLAPKRVVHRAPREPWRAGPSSSLDTALPSLAREAASISAWVPTAASSSEELPQIEEIANKIASRYAGGLSKLHEVQREWRQKHDALLQRRKAEPRSAEPQDVPKGRSTSANNEKARHKEAGAEQSSLLTHLSSRGPSKSTSLSPRRRPKKKVVSPSDEEGSTEEPPRRDTSIQVLRTGFADLFQATREAVHDMEPERSKADGEEEGLLDAQTDAAGPGQGAESSGPDVATEEKPKRMVPYKPDAAPRPVKAAQSQKKPRWSRPQAEEIGPGDIERHGRELTYATCIELAKKHRLTVPIVRQSLEEFLDLDKNSDGKLSYTEFEQALRDRCSIPPGESVPSHLLNMNWNKADTDNDDEICFEEFLLWSTEHAFTEELVVNDPKERYLRELARRHNFTLDEVERCHKTFSACDSNRNGFIEEAEFRNAVATLWNCDLEDISVKRLRQFWLEADKARLGKLGFEVFLVWYVTIGAQ